MCISLTVEYTSHIGHHIRRSKEKQKTSKRKCKKLYNIRLKAICTKFLEKFMETVHVLKEMKCKCILFRIKGKDGNNYTSI